ncbi:sperm axonemal maintenance protein CFAP97D1 [Aplochiton taeniatus]
MHKAFQPLKPATNKLLQRRWDQTQYEQHRTKVSTAQPIVDTKGMKTPAHIQLKLKKRQLHEERLAIIERDNQLLSAKLSDIVCSKGLVDHWNHYPERSLNAEKRRDQLLQVTHQNRAIYQRITARKSEYRRQLWLDDWEKVEQRRDDIARYPRGLTNKQTPSCCVLHLTMVGIHVPLEICTVCDDSEANAFAAAHPQ